MSRTINIKDINWCNVIDIQIYHTINTYLGAFQHPPKRIFGIEFTIDYKMFGIIKCKKVRQLDVKYNTISKAEHKLSELFETLTYHRMKKSTTNALSALQTASVNTILDGLSDSQQVDAIDDVAKLKIACKKVLKHLEQRD